MEAGKCGDAFTNHLEMSKIFIFFVITRSYLNLKSQKTYTDSNMLTDKEKKKKNMHLIYFSDMGFKIT